MDKKLKISLDLDDKSFQQGIKRAMDQIQAMQRDPKHMQAQMQIDQRLRSMGYGGLPGAPGYDQMVASRKKGEQEQKRYIEDLLKSQDRIIKNESRLGSLKNAQLKAGKDIKDTEKTLETLSERKLKNEGMLAQATEKRVRTYRELLSNMEKEFKLGGVGGLKQAWGGMNSTERAGFGLTTAGGVIGAVSMGADYLGRRNIDIAGMQGSATQATIGRQLRESRTGEYTFESMYGGDRQKATEEAKRARSLGTAADIGKLIAGTAVAAGALLAIPTGGLSMGAGLGIAGVAGGLAGSSIMKGILDPTKYAAYRSQQEGQDFTSMLESQHQLSPYRKNAIERLKDTGSRDLGMQRALGLSDQGYYGAGGYLQPQMGLGFNDEMITGASQGILGAGGSTAMARKSGTALQAQRGLNLTNAPDLLGMLSGTQSIPETSKKSLIEIFARGFDNSKFAEENRKYMQGVSEQVFRGGSTSADSAANIAEMMRSAIGSMPTTRGIEAGKSAFEAFQTAGTATSGYLGGINVASAMRDPSLSKLQDPAELQALLRLKPNEIDETDPDFISSAKKMGLSGPALAKKLRDRQVGNVKSAMGGRSGMAARGMIGTLFPGLGAPEQKAFANILNQAPSAERDSHIKEMMAKAEKGMNEPTGRAGDTMVQASAINARTSLETLSASINKFAEDAMVAAKKLSVETTAGRTAEAGSHAPAVGNGDAASWIRDKLGMGPLPPSHQKQGN